VKCRRGQGQGITENLKKLRAINDARQRECPEEECNVKRLPNTHAPERFQRVQNPQPTKKTKTAKNHKKVKKARAKSYQNNYVEFTRGEKSKRHPKGLTEKQKTRWGQ